MRVLQVTCSGAPGNEESEHNMALTCFFRVCPLFLINLISESPFISHRNRRRRRRTRMYRYRGRERTKKINYRGGDITDKSVVVRRRGSFLFVPFFRFRVFLFKFCPYLRRRKTYQISVDKLPR